MCVLVERGVVFVGPGSDRDDSFIFFSCFKCFLFVGCGFEKYTGYNNNTAYSQLKWIPIEISSTKRLKKENLRPLQRGHFVTRRFLAPTKPGCCMAGYALVSIR